MGTTKVACANDAAREFVRVSQCGAEREREKENESLRRRSTTEVGAAVGGGKTRVSRARVME